MATPPAAAPDFCTLLTKSKLLPAGEVEALYRRWKDETGSGDEHVEAFGKYLVGKHVLTPWQAALLQRGRADGFFLDQYKILEQLGKGQMGGVYKAVHALGQTVALKILPASRAKDSRVLGRFQREARLLTQLDHPNVVRAFQVGESGGRHFIVMEFLEGETLDEILARRKRLPVGEAVRVVRQALDGLQHLHEKRMVHRDLKPANLMVVPAAGKDARHSTLEATVKILDIGLGRELFDENAPAALIDTQLTVEGSVVGTPDYMSPEQAKDARSSDIRADIYSLGCVLYHCLTGRPPFPDTNIMTQMLRHATETPTPLAELVPETPAALQAALNMMIAKRPEDRYQTPAEASAALALFLSPGAGSKPSGADVIPAYRQWLQSETQLEVPNPLQPVPAPNPPPAKPKPGTATAAPLPPPPKPGTGPAPTLPAGGKAGPSGAVPRPVPVPPPPARPTPPPPAAPHPAPAPVPAHGATAPYPVPAPAPLPRQDEVEVELVMMPPVSVPQPAEPPPEFRPEERPLWDPSRRDLMMLVAGGLGVIGAVGLGYGLSRLARALKSSPAEEGENKE